MNREHITSIYGGGTSIDHRAEGEKQAQDYRASQRCQDWEHLARDDGEPGGSIFFVWVIVFAMLAGATVVALS